MVDAPELRAYRAVLAHPKTPHLDDAAWERLASGQMSRSERARSLDHVTSCAACATICRGLLVLEDEARAFDPDVPDPALSVPQEPARTSRWAYGGLAALAASLAWLALAPLAKVPGAQETLRSAEHAARPSPLAPLGRLAAPPQEFRWQAFPGASGYRVELFDGLGTMVWSSPRTEGTTVRWPAHVAAAPGRYYWQVVALTGRSAEAVVSSPTVDFDVVGPARP